MKLLLLVVGVLGLAVVLHQQLHRRPALTRRHRFTAAQVAAFLLRDLEPV